MNKINEEMIKALKAIPLTESKEWRTFGDGNKSFNRDVALKIFH